MCYHIYYRRYDGIVITACCLSLRSSRINDFGKYGIIKLVCVSSQDIEALPHSDMSIIGEHGYELLFGQKVKISLARTIYRQADIYLLDDPFGMLVIKIDLGYTSSKLI